MNKKGRQFFSGKKTGATPSVAAPGDINPSDATGHNEILSGHHTAYWEALSIRFSTCWLVPKLALGLL